MPFNKQISPFWWENLAAHAGFRTTVSHELWGPFTLQVSSVQRPCAVCGPRGHIQTTGVGSGPPTWLGGCSGDLSDEHAILVSYGPQVEVDIACLTKGARTRLSAGTAVPTPARPLPQEPSPHGLSRRSPLQTEAAMWPSLVSRPGSETVTVGKPHRLGMAGTRDATGKGWCPGLCEAGGMFFFFV